jgi:hypothetical protein
MTWLVDERFGSEKISCVTFHIRGSGPALSAVQGNLWGVSGPRQTGGVGSLAAPFAVTAVICYTSTSEAPG